MLVNTIFAISLACYATASPARRATCDSSTLNTTISYYIVKAGQTLKDVAKATNRGICDIARFNRLADPGLIYVGENITIPAEFCKPSNSGCQVKPNANYTKSCVMGAGHTYYTYPGDTIGIVAARFDMNADDLLAANTRQGATSIDGALPTMMNLKIPQCNNSFCLTTPYKFLTAATYADLCAQYGCVVGQMLGYNNGYNHSAGGTDGVHGPLLTLVYGCQFVPGALDYSAVV